MLEAVLGRMPARLLGLLDEVPLIVLDEPTPDLLRDLGIPRDAWREEAELLCGLHSGLSLLDQSVEISAELPEQIHVFRRGIVGAAGGWEHRDAIEEEIRVTLLHEIGHHFGLDEDDLESLGYA
jgi:predicted Zn-dependent protease with MMP-like domain